MSGSRSDRCVFLSTSVTGYLGLVQLETIDVSTAQKTISVYLAGKTLGNERKLSLRFFGKLVARVASGLKWLRIVSN
jgi:hypothetical protein